MENSILTIETQYGVYEQKEDGLYFQVFPPTPTRPKVNLDELMFEINEWGLQGVDTLALEEAVTFPKRKVKIAPVQSKKILFKKTIFIEKPQESYIECAIMQDGIYGRLNKVGGKSLDLNKAISQIKELGIENFYTDAVKECLLKDAFWIKIAPLPESKDLKDGEVLVKLSGDKITAEIVVFPPFGGDFIKPDDVKIALQRQGVVVVPDDEQLEVLCEMGKDKKATLVLKGKMPTKGEDAKVEYLFEHTTEGKPKEMEDGRVDWRELNLIKKVYKGDILARKIPPTQGEEGITVTGEKIEGLYGKDIPLPQGKGTVVSEDGWSLLAAVDGSVAQIGNKICVLPVCEIKKDVDFTTGNIDFPGNVKIPGSVKAGFKVKADGNIEIYGNIEDATVSCGGKLNVMGGIFGREKCKVTAGDDITCKFITNSSVYSSSNIKVYEEIMHSYVSANKKVIMIGKRGVIAGGKITAGEEVVSRVIGSQYATPTEIEVGIIPEVRKELKDLEKNIEMYKSNLSILKEAILKYEEKQKKEGLSLQKKHNLIKLIRQQYNIMDSLNKSLERREQLNEIVEATKNARVVVQDKIYPGVKIVIKKAVLKVSENIKSPVFYEDSGEVKLKYQKVVKKSK